MIAERPGSVIIGRLFRPSLLLLGVIAAVWVVPGSGAFARGKTSVSSWAKAKGKMKPEDLKAAIPNYDGLVVRSAAKVTKEIIEAGTKLKIVGRASGMPTISRSSAPRLRAAFP